MVPISPEEQKCPRKRAIPATPSQPTPSPCAPSTRPPRPSPPVHQFSHFPWKRAGFGLAEREFKAAALLTQPCSHTQAHLLAFGSRADNVRFCSPYILGNSSPSSFIHFPGAAQGTRWLTASLEQGFVQTQHSRAEKKLSLLFAFDADMTFLHNVLPVWRSVNHQRKHHSPQPGLSQSPSYPPKPFLATQRLFLSSSVIYFPDTQTAALRALTFINISSLFGLIFSTDTSSF